MPNSFTAVTLSETIGKTVLKCSFSLRTQVTLTQERWLSAKCELVTLPKRHYIERVLGL